MKSFWLCLLCCLICLQSPAGTDAQYQQALAEAQTRHPDMFDQASPEWYWMTQYADAVRVWAAQGQPESVALLARPDRGLSQIIEWSRGRIAEAAAEPIATATPSKPASAPAGKVTTIIGIGSGAYTTSTGDVIIEAVPGVWEVHHKDGTVQRIIKP